MVSNTLDAIDLYHEELRQQWRMSFGTGKIMPNIPNFLQRCHPEIRDEVRPLVELVTLLEEISRTRLSEVMELLSPEVREQMRKRMVPFPPGAEPELPDSYKQRSIMDEIEPSFFDYNNRSIMNEIEPTEIPIKYPSKFAIIYSRIKYLFSKKAN